MTFYDSSYLPHELPKGEPVSWRISAYGLVQNKSGQILVVVPTWRESYDLPGGGVDLGEKISEGIIREVYEESGYRVSLDSALPFHIEETNFFHDDERKFYHSINVFYKCKLESKVQDLSAINKVVENEIAKVEWKNLNDLTSDNTFINHFKALQAFREKI